MKTKLLALAAAMARRAPQTYGTFLYRPQLFRTFKTLPPRLGDTHSPVVTGIPYIKQLVTIQNQHPYLSTSARAQVMKFSAETAELMLKLFDKTENQSFLSR